MSSTAAPDTDKRDNSVRPLDVTGYGNLDEPPALEVAPLTDAIAFDVEPRGEDVAVDVETVAPGEIPVRSSGTLSREQARALREELDEALGREA
jgi:hypothetical protein